MVDRSNEVWLQALRSSGPEQDEALVDLHAYLQRAALFYVRRRAPELSGVSNDELEALAEDAAQEASLHVLGKLDTFRGDARFLTWCGAIAVGWSMVSLRRRLWRDLSLEQLTDGWQEPAQATLGGDGWAHPQLASERNEIWETIREVVTTELTERQQQVMNLLLIHGVNAEEVADRLGTSPGALYKLTHDARRKLKASLLKRGFTTEEILSAFAAKG
jgi:RNA polymerase sigma-70 factor (ECF subfamily)